MIPLTDDNSPWYVYILTAIPALLLTILLFMDQQITSVIVNRKEHKLKVRHLDNDKVVLFFFHYAHMHYAYLNL